MRCPSCNAWFDVGEQRDCWVACPHCDASAWLGHEPDVEPSEPDREQAGPGHAPKSDERIEIDLSCPGLVNPSTGIALIRSGNIGIFRDLKVFVDGVQVGRLAHDQRKVFRADPGARAIHVMMDWCASEPYAVDISEGQIVELNCRPGSSAAHYKLNTMKALLTPNQFFVIERVQ